jgi:hypothetical protein
MKIIPVVSAALRKHWPSERGVSVPQQADREGGGHAHGRTLRRGERAAVDPAEDAEEDQHHRPHASQQREHLLRALRRGGRTVTRGHPHVHGDADQVEHHGQQRRQECRGEQLGDVLLGENPVHDQHHGGRQEDAERASGSQRRRGEPSGVVVRTHLRQRDLRDRGGRRHRGAGHRSERGTRQERSHRHPAAHAPDQRIGEGKQIAREPPLRGQLPHQQEQRDHRQVVHGEPRVRETLQMREQRRLAGERHVRRDARHEHRHGDRHAQRHQHQHACEDRDADGDAAHRAFQFSAAV